MAEVSNTESYTPASDLHRVSLPLLAAFHVVAIAYRLLSQHYQAGCNRA
jgi:hypothetical protein